MAVERYLTVISEQVVMCCDSRFFPQVICITHGVSRESGMLTVEFTLYTTKLNEL